MTPDLLRARQVRRLTWIVRSGVAMAVAGALWVVWPQQRADGAVRLRALEPAFTSPRPRAVVDEGHFNLDTTAGHHQSFARLLRQDGFRVSAGQGAITPVLLRGVDVYVTANALGYLGLAQQVADRMGFERLVRLTVRPFSDAEIATLAAWVRAGGRALILADPGPAAHGSRLLAQAFGVEMTTWWLQDVSQSGASAEVPSTLVFSREAGLLGTHPILDGRNERERINRVMTFRGQALRPGPHGVGLLLTSADAREYPYQASPGSSGRSAAGLAQAVAVTFGAGRVVVMGEADVLAAQPGEGTSPAGLSVGLSQDTDNRQFALNVMRWLMGVLP